MKCLFTLDDANFYRLPSGEVYTDRSLTYQNFWQTLAEVFDEVRVCSRMQPVEAADPQWERADGRGVQFIQLPFYRGLLHFLRVSHAFNTSIKQQVLWADVIMSYLPGNISRLAFEAGGRHQKVRVGCFVGDPYDVLAPGAITHPLRPFLRYWITRMQKQHALQSDSALYVTEVALQARYPTLKGILCASISDVSLPDEAFVEQPRVYRTVPVPLRLVNLGTLRQLYKAPDLLVQSVYECRQQGLDVELTWIGDGRFRAEMVALAQQLGIADGVHFIGELPAGKAVRYQLDQADLFVMPSRQEGLPRAMLEAMARAIPCIGSDVGGLPEILPPADMCPMSQLDSACLTRKILEIATSPSRLNEMSAHALQTARRYHRETVTAKRRAFYQQVRQLAENRL